MINKLWRVSRCFRIPCVVPLALLTVIFIGYAVPPYVSLDPAQARIQPMPPVRRGSSASA
jgi:hypothetical protein